MTQQGVAGVLDSLGKRAQWSTTLDADAWSRKSQYPELAKDIATSIRVPEEIAGVGGRQAALFIQRLGQRALRDTKGLSRAGKRQYVRAMFRAIASLIGDLRPARLAPDRARASEHAFNYVRDHPKAHDVLRLAIENDVDGVFPALEGLHGLKPSARIFGRCFSADSANVLAKPVKLLVTTEGTIEPDRLVDVIGEDKGPEPLVLVTWGSIDEPVFQRCVAAAGRELYGVQTDQSLQKMNELVDGAGLLQSVSRGFSCASGMVRGVTFDDLGAAFVAPSPWKVSAEPNVSIVTDFAQSDPEWAHVDRAFRGYRTAISSGVIDRAGFSKCRSLFGRRMQRVTSEIQRAAIKGVLDAAGELSESIRGEMPVQALAHAMWSSGNGVARILDLTPSLESAAAGTRSESLPLLLSTVPQYPTSSEPPGAGRNRGGGGSDSGEGGGRGGGGRGGSGGGDEGGGDGDSHSRAAHRYLDVDLNGDIVPGKRVNVLATIYLTAPALRGEWGKPVDIDPSGGPVTFRMTARGFKLLSPASIERTVPDDAATEPAAFVLEVEEATERWIELALFQAGSPVTTVLINNFALNDIRRRQEIRRQAEVDLTVTVDGAAAPYELRGDSPKVKEDLADRLFGPLQMPRADVLDRVFAQIEALYQGDEPASVERELKIIGAEVRKCLPKDLLDRLSSGRVRTMFVRHEIGNVFPFELALLDDGKEEFFLADRIAICRWLRNLDNAATSDTKQVRQAAVMRGQVRIARAESQLLRTVCKRAKAFDSPKDVRSQVFSNRGFELLHFIGHCLEEKDDMYLELAKGALGMREIGELRAERAFGEAAPIVVINGCGTGRSIPSLFGPDSFPSRFLAAKASAFVGTLWSVEDKLAHDFSRAFYANLAAGRGIGEAMLETKRGLTSTSARSGRRVPAASEAWRRIALRGYCVFAHPEMKVTFSTAA